MKLLDVNVSSLRFQLVVSWLDKLKHVDLGVTFCWYDLKEFSVFHEEKLTVDGNVNPLMDVFRLHRVFEIDLVRSFNLRYLRKPHC